MNFISDCLDSDAQLVGGDQQMRPDGEEGSAHRFIDGGSARPAYLGILFVRA